MTHRESLKKINFLKNFKIFKTFFLFVSQDEDIPQKPLPGAISQVRYKLLDLEYYHKLKEEFNKRPIWSKNALRARLRFSKDKLKARNFLDFIS